MTHAWTRLALAIVMLGPGCDGPEDTRTPCQGAAECGPTGRALCHESFCVQYHEAMGEASLELDLSFGRDMYQIAYSCSVHVLWPRLADGSPLGCQELLARTVLPDDPRVNPLQVEPRFLRLHWSGGGTLFPGNLIQFIWPGQDLRVLAEAYYQSDGSGPLRALGCLEGVDLTAGSTTRATVSLTRVP
jgi:hypothetical protein